MRLTPASASAATMALPMPRLLPVTSATVPAGSKPPSGATAIRRSDAAAPWRTQSLSTAIVQKANPWRRRSGPERAGVVGRAVGGGSGLGGPDRGGRVPGGDADRGMEGARIPQPVLQVEDQRVGPRLAGELGDGGRARDQPQSGHRAALP